MASLHPPVCDFNWPLPDFKLRNVDGRMISRDAAMGKNGLLVMFICNHCPYVKAIQARLAADCRALLAYGVHTVAIQSNDTANYPEDNFENMQLVAQQQGYSFPYLLDEDQTVAQRFGAICTPDFFGFNAQGALQYRGRFDAAGRGEPPENNAKDLLEAMKMIAQTGAGPRTQIASIGCSIKWRIA